MYRQYLAAGNSSSGYGPTGYAGGAGDAWDDSAIMKVGGEAGAISIMSTVL
jgi:hypothetical protein